MEISLNHTIVYSFNNVDSAKFYEKIFAFQFLKVWGSFAVLRVNSTLCFDFVTREKFTKQHYAFKVNDKEFDEIFQRVKDNNLDFGSGPNSLDDGKINHNFNGRGVYFLDPNAHILEIITSDYIID